MGRPLVRDRNLALYLGLAAWLAGGILLWDAWENRGQDRPLIVRLVGAVL